MLEGMKDDGHVHKRTLARTHRYSAADFVVGQLEESSSEAVDKAHTHARTHTLTHTTRTHTYAHARTHTHTHPTWTSHQLR